MGDYAFDADTRVTACEPSGSFDAELTGRWNGTNGAVNGGYMLATCLRALSEAMPFRDPIVVSAFFLRPGTAGPGVIRTSLTRSGRTTSFGEPKAAFVTALITAPGGSAPRPRSVMSPPRETLPSYRL